MRFQYIILIIFGIIFGLMLGSFLFGISLGFLPQENLLKEIERLYSHGFITFLVAIFLYAICYVVTKTLIKRLTREEIYIIEDEFSRVSVSLGVVENVVKKVLRKFQNVKKYKLNLYPRNKKLTIRIRVKEWEGEDVTTNIKPMSEELKIKLDKIVGLKQNFEIEIKIESIKDPGWDQ